MLYTSNILKNISILERLKKMEKKISINMLSSADKVPGQGVGSAYLELIKLLKKKQKMNLM